MVKFVWTSWNVLIGKNVLTIKVVRQGLVHTSVEKQVNIHTRNSVYKSFLLYYCVSYNHTLKYDWRHSSSTFYIISFSSCVSPSLVQLHWLEGTGKTVLSFRARWTGWLAGWRDWRPPLVGHPGFYKTLSKLVALISIICFFLMDILIRGSNFSSLLCHSRTTTPECLLLIIMTF